MSLLVAALRPARPELHLVHSYLLCTSCESTRYGTHLFLGASRFELLPAHNKHITNHWGNLFNVQFSASRLTLVYFVLWPSSSFVLPLFPDVIIVFVVLGTALCIWGPLRLRAPQRL